MEGLDNRTLKYFNRGNILNKEGVYEKAIEYYDRVLKVHPMNHVVWSHKARALVEISRISEAMECYNIAIELQPNNASLWNNKGYAYLRQSEYKSALECYKKAIKLRPDYARAWYNKGYILDKLGKYDSSLKCYNKAIELNTDNEKYVTARQAVLEKISNIKDSACASLPKTREYRSPRKATSNSDLRSSGQITTVPRTSSKEKILLNSEFSNIFSTLENLQNIINNSQSLETLTVVEQPIYDLLSSIKEKKESLIRKNEESNQTCVICLDYPPNMVCIPCGHMCLCDECKLRMTKKKCPVCNQQVKNIYKVQALHY